METEDEKVERIANDILKKAPLTQKGQEMLKESIRKMIRQHHYENTKENETRSQH